MPISIEFLTCESDTGDCPPATAQLLSELHDATLRKWIAFAPLSLETQGPISVKFGDRVS